MGRSATCATSCSSRRSRDRLVTAQVGEERSAFRGASGAHSAPARGASGAHTAPALGGDIAGIALWASVSEEVDLSIRRQIREGVFPIKLKADDWTSGNINWLLDVIAADKAMTARVIANFRQVVKEGGLRLHPLIARLVDEETLKKMGVEKKQFDLCGAA